MFRYFTSLIYNSLKYFIWILTSKVWKKHCNFVNFLDHSLIFKIHIIFRIWSSRLATLCLWTSSPLNIVTVTWRHICQAHCFQTCIKLMVHQIKNARKDAILYQQRFLIKYQPYTTSPTWSWYFQCKMWEELMTGPCESIWILKRIFYATSVMGLVQVLKLLIYHVPRCVEFLHDNKKDP